MRSARRRTWPRSSPRRPRAADRVPPPKLMSMRDAVARFVPDGASICMGTALEALIPFAAGHELIRQRRRDLTLIGPISDILFDQLIGAGCVRRVIAAWVGNVSAGLGYNYRRAVEQRIPAPLEVQDHSNLTIAFALQAAALGVPYLPTRSLLGTDLPRANPTFKEAADPWSGAPLLLVPAIAPDVAILHVQRADEEGHAHVWGTLGVARPAAAAPGAPRRRALPPMKNPASGAVPLPAPPRRMNPPSPWTGGTRKQIFVRVHTDEGVSGLGEAFAYGAPLAVVSVIEESLAPLIVGQDPLRIEAVVDLMHRGTMIYGPGGVGTFAIIGIEIALWDLAGK